MKKSRGSTWVLLVVGVAVVAAIGYVAAARGGMFNTRYDDVAKVSAAPPSKFIDVNGVKVHIRDEGTGPAILMLHSSMTNLHVWDAWADNLKTDYRVIRIDWPPYGLTIDNTGEAGTPHAAKVVEGVLEQLKVDKVILIGSSSGATLSVVYAAEHPERVRGLALSTLPLKTPPGMKSPWKMQAYAWYHKNLVPNYKSKDYWRTFLSTMFAHPDRITDAHVNLFHDTNNLEGGYARVNKYYQANVKGVWSTGAGGYAGKVTAPILLQWGDADPVLPPYLSKEAVKEFANSKVSRIHYDLGHYPQLEGPQETIGDLRKFLAALPPVDAPTATPPVASASAASTTAPAPAKPAAQ